MSIDGYPPEAIEEILETDLDYLKEAPQGRSDLLMIAYICPRFRFDWNTHRSGADAAKYE